MLFLNNDRQEQTKNILFYVNGISQLENSYLIFKENPDIMFFVISVSNINMQDFYNSKLRFLKNLILNDNSVELIYKIEKFGMLITTVCSGAYCCRTGLQVISICLNIGIPVVELQHGLFEYGLHYNVEPKCFETQYDFLDVDNFTDYLLSYYPVVSKKRDVTVIGFPKYYATDIDIPLYTANYVLILTNFNWDCFTSEDFNVFLGALLKVVTQNSEINFIWKPHPAEIQFFIDKRINLDFYPNITIAQLDNLTKLLTLDNLIKYADKVISTISTVLLDCEAYNKDTAIFKSDANSELLTELNNFYSFSSYEELSFFVKEKTKSKLQTGKLLKYNNSLFRKFILEKYHLPIKDNKKILQAILEKQKII